MIGSFVELTSEANLEVTNQTKKGIKEKFNCNIHYGRMFTIPCVSIEEQNILNGIKNEGYIALDLETGPFLAACENNSILGICIHWVTDLPLERDFYYPYYGDKKIIQQDKLKKHNQWLNMPNMILAVLLDLL